MSRMSAERYRAGEKFTCAEILEACAEIISLETFENDAIDALATTTVQSIFFLQKIISNVDAIYEPWED